MVAILEKGEFNFDFHPMVDFIAVSPLRYALTVKPTIFVSHIRQFWSTARIETTDDGTHILATVDGIQRIVSESSPRRNLKLRDEDGIVSIPDTELFENLTLMGIVPFFDTMFIHQGEGSGTPTEPHHTPFPEADTSSHPTTSSIPLPSIPTAPIPPVTQPDTTPIKQYSRRARIAQSSVLPTVADKPASPVRDERVQVLADREGDAAKQFRDDAPIKGRSINEGKAATERICNDSEEVARVLTSMDAATVLAGGINVPTSSRFIPTAGPPATIISTDSEVCPTASLIVTRRKGKEVMVEELEEKQEKENMRMNEQIARDAEVARIHAEEELQGMINSLDNLQVSESTEKANDQEAVEGILYGCDQKQLGVEKEKENKQKLSEEAPEIETSTEDVTEEKIKEMMQLVPVEDVYVQALQVKHPIIDRKVHTE
nr:hypothetical protein [Tanacetum cinerariifolium]